MAKCTYEFQGKKYNSYKELVDELQRLGLDSGAIDALYAREDAQLSNESQLDKISLERKTRPTNDDEMSFSPGLVTKANERSVTNVIDTPEFETAVGDNRMPKMSRIDYVDTMKNYYVSNGTMSSTEADAWAEALMKRWDVISKNAFDFHRIVMQGQGSDKDFESRCKGTAFEKMHSRMAEVEETIFKRVLFDRNTKSKISSGGPNIRRSFNFDADLNVIGGQVLGHVDYLVNNEDGTIELYNIKTSTQPYSAWPWEMKEKYRYEMAMLKRMLEFNGIDMKYARVHIIPVQLQYDSKFENVTQVNVQDIVHVDTADMSARMFERFERVAMKFVDSHIKAEKLSFASFDEVNRQLNIIFKGKNIRATGARREAKDWVRKNWKYCDPKARPGGGYTLTLPETGEKIEVSDTRRGSRNGEFVDKIGKLISEDYESITGEKSAHYIIEDIKKSYSSLGFFKSSMTGRRIKGYLEKALSPYFVHEEEKVNDKKIFKYDWELFDSPVLERANIIMFHNHKTDQCDIIDITSLDPGQKISFKAGRKNLLGSHLMDMNSEGFDMEANYGNIEAVRVMALLNEIMPDMPSSYELGTLRVISPSMFHSKQGATFDFESLVDVWNTVVKVANTNAEAGITNRFGTEKINIIDQRKILMKLWESLCAKTEFDMTEMTAMKDILERNVDEFGNEKGGLMDATDTAAKIEIINELLERIKYVMRDEMSFGNIKNVIDVSRFNDRKGAFAKLYLQGSKVLAMLNGDAVIDNADINYIQKNMLKPTSMNNSIIRKIGFIMQNTIDSIRGRVLGIYNTEISDLFEEYYKDAGYSKIRNTLIGDQSVAYRNLFVYDEDGKNTLMLKNPYDNSNDLKGYERKFLKKFLYELYKMRCEVTGQKLNISGTEDSRLLNAMPENYLRIPLERASLNSRRANLRAMFERTQERLHKAVSDFRGTLDDIRSYLSEDGMADISKTSADEMRTYNPFQETESDYNSWRASVSDKGTDYFETNLENIFIDFLFRQVRCDEMNKMLLRTSAIELAIATKGIDENNTSSTNEILNYIDEYLLRNVHEGSIMEKGTRVLDKLIAPLRRFVSQVFIANSPYAFVRDILQGLEANFVRVATKFQTNVDVKDLVWSYGFVMRDSLKSIGTMSLLNQMNIKYGFSNFDAAKVAERIKTGRGGVLNPEYWRYWSLRGPDYLNRMTLFMARLKHDGSYDAYGLDEKGKLVYDWRKDKRFDVYKDPSKKGTAKYKEQQALYQSLIRQLNIENPELNLAYTDDLPDGYTMQQIRAIKTLGESIYGAYDTASRNRAENMAIGRNFMFFFTWLNGMLDNYFKGTQKSQSQLMTRQATDYNGKPLYFKDDGTITTEQTDMPVQEDVPVIVQGIFNTIGMTIKEIADPEFDSQYFLDQVKNNPQLMANYRRLFADLLVAMIMGLLYSLWAKPAYKQYKSEMDGEKYVQNVTAELFYRGWTRSYDVFTGPLAIVKYFGESTNPASYDLGKKFVTDTYKVLAGKSGFGATMLSYDAFYRSMQDSFQGWLKSKDYSGTFAKKSSEQLAKEKEERKAAD